MFECVDFAHRFPEDYNLVCESLRAQPIILNSNRIGCCHRRRLFWASWTVEALPYQPTDANLIMDSPYRTVAPQWYRNGVGCLPTLMSAGPSSHNMGTCVQQTDWYGYTYLTHLTPSEYEKTMLFPEGCTNIRDHTGRYLTPEERYRAVGNSQHVGVLEHIIKSLFHKLRLY